MIKKWIATRLLKIKLWFKKHELRITVKNAERINQRTGKTVLIVNTDKGLMAIPKSDFKRLWGLDARFKKVTLYQWYARSDHWYQTYEDLKPENKFINSN